ncbi:MAG: molecular chaperone DjiA [Alphaproteobacteria bacterium]|nr:molecular chaperone DjiA [Alphaproteobacteria bacterium]
MALWHKLLAGAAGFAVGGPIGALVGGLAAYAYEDDIKKVVERLKPAPDPTRSTAFTVGVIALGAKMASVDGEVTGDEIRAFRQVFHVDDAEAAKLERIFEMAKRTPDSYEAYARQLAGLFEPGSTVLEELMHCLFHVATVDGELDPREHAYLRSVSEIFGFDERGFERLSAHHMEFMACEPCLFLGVAADAPVAEIKAAYRRLVREHHPDRLIGLGMPEEAIRVATDRLATITQAYERLKVQRGFT